MNKTIGNQDFEVLQEQTNSDEAKQIERQWKKKVQKEKDRCYTKLMLIAIAVMVIIFIILISFLSEDKKHVQLKTISYKNTDYIYLQSNIPHLKFLYPKQQDTQQIKYLKGLGILYPDLIKWIQSNLQQNMKVLFIPNEKSAVNVLGISLGYYLNASKGGSLDIVVSQIKYQEMTIKNIQQMNNERVQGSKIPINLIIDGIQLDYSKYNLIVIENNNQYKKIINAQNAKIIIIKNKIQLNIFPNHKKFGIVKGKTNDKVRQFQFKYGYAIIPQDINNINTLLIPKSIQDIQECQQKNIMLKNQQTALRNIAIYLHNKTFTQTTIYYGLQNNVAIKLIAQIPTISKLYSKHDFNLANVNPIKNKDINNVQNNKQIIFSEINYYIVNYDSSIIYNIKDKDTFFILLQNEEEVNNLLKQYINEKITMMSPYNNGGCFYPPAISSYKKLQPFIPFFMILRSSK